MEHKKKKKSINHSLLHQGQVQILIIKQNPL